MGKFIEQLGQTMATGAASSIPGAILGMGLGAYNDNRQEIQQRHLQNLQIQGEKEMTDYNMAKQLQMWKDTGYSAQMEQMKKAGLNPALLYGMSGGGGQTTGQANGNVTGGQAPQGGHEIQDIMGITMQQQLLKAQIDNINADTKNKLSENPNIPRTGENIEANTANTKQTTTNLKVDQEMKEIDVRINYVKEQIAGQTQNIAIAAINTALRQETEKLQLLTNEKRISDATVKTKIEQITAQLVQTYAETELKRTQAG